MDNLLSGYLWGYKNWQAADIVFKKFRQFYPNSDLFCKVDFEGDYENYENICKKWNVIISKNEFQVGYCGNFTSSNYSIGRDHWPKQNAFHWLDNIYYACINTNSKYMIILEEDVFILKNISILNHNFDAAIVRNNNIMHGRLLNFISSFNGNVEDNLYGCCGGVIINVKKLIYSWELCREKLWEEFDDIAKYTKTIGWSDCILQVIIQSGGGRSVFNMGLVEPWMQEQGWINDDWHNYEVVNYLKDMEEINKL